MTQPSSQQGGRTESIESTEIETVAQRTTPPRSGRFAQAAQNNRKEPESNPICGLICSVFGRSQKGYILPPRLRCSVETPALERPPPFALFFAMLVCGNGWPRPSVEQGGRSSAGPPPRIAQRIAPRVCFLADLVLRALAAGCVIRRAPACALCVRLGPFGGGFLVQALCILHSIRPCTS